MTTARQLDDRYGRTGRRRLPWIIGITLAVLVVGAFSWMTVNQSMNSVTADDLGYQVIDEHSVEVRFQVAGMAGRDVVCAVEALDEEFGVVGWKIVEIAGGEQHTQAHTARVPTVAGATTGLVNSCWVA